MNYERKYFMFLINYGRVEMPGNVLARCLFDNICEVFGQLSMTVDCFEVPACSAKASGALSVSRPNANVVERKRPASCPPRPPPAARALSFASSSPVANTVANAIRANADPAHNQKRVFLHCRPLRWV